MTRFLSVADVCRVLNVSRDYVYAHRTEMGAIRLNDSKSAPLRFAATDVARFIELHADKAA